SAARYVPVGEGWKPSSEYSGSEASRFHAARQASPAGSNRPPTSAAAFEYERLTPSKSCERIREGHTMYIAVRAPARWISASKRFVYARSSTWDSGRAEGPC